MEKFKLTLHLRRAIRSRKEKTMHKIMITRMFIIAVLLNFALAALLQPAFASASSDMSPILIQFDKQGGINGIWTGTISGDVEGNLTTQLLSAQQSGPVLHVTFAWIISAGDQSFTAELKGTLNTLTGQVEMDGTVVEGWLLGAQVHEEGQLVDPSTMRFQGTIQVMPATVD
jgi:hypothetical protein